MYGNYIPSHIWSNKKRIYDHGISRCYIISVLPWLPWQLWRGNLPLAPQEANDKSPTFAPKSPLNASAMSQKKHIGVFLNHYFFLQRFVLTCSDYQFLTAYLNKLCWTSGKFFGVYKRSLRRNLWTSPYPASLHLYSSCLTLWWTNIAMENHHV